MIGLAVLAAATAAQPLQGRAREPLLRQATASVRILSGARITATETPVEALVKMTELENSDGSRSTARLIEFQ